MPPPKSYRLAAAALTLATAATALVTTTGVAHASTSAPAITNPGFETGTLAGWSVSGSYSGSGAPVQSYAGRTAPDGKYFAVVTGGCFSSTLKQQFTAIAGQTLRGWAFFQSNESSTSYNDTGSVQLAVSGSGTSATVFSSSVKQVGGVGTTPWRQWSYTFPASGTYTIAATSTNALDCSGASVVGIDLAGSDAIAPTVNASATSNGSPYTSGTWTDKDVDVTFSCADNAGGSGVASVTPKQTVSTEGAGQSVTGTCTDFAGNTASTTFTDIRIDKSAPTIEAAATSDASPYTSGTWTDKDVEVGFSCTDDAGGSGVATVSPAQTVSTEGTGLSVPGTCTDNAGNTASTTFTDIRIDTTTPSAGSTATSGGSPYTSGTWTNSSVDVAFTCTDNAGGSGVATVSPDQTVSTEGAGQSVPGTCTDNAGNTASTTFTDIRIDKTAPVAAFDAVVGGLTDGASYTWGSTPEAPTCTASDSLSGPDGCTVTGYSSAVGTHTLTATASDAAGNSGTSTWTYTVDPWTTPGFYRPVDMGGVVNTVKNGSTVPVKFNVHAGDTEVTDTSVLTMSAARISCTTGATEDAIEVTSTGATSLRYDVTAGQFVYNWATPRTAGACYALTMTTDDGSSTKALFKLK